METSNHLAHWHELFLMLGSTAGVIVGLLFIVMSLHLDKIKGQVDDNLKLTMEGSRNNNYHLLTVLIGASLVLAPQPIHFLGAELILLNLYGLRLPLNILYRYSRRNITISKGKGFPYGTIATIISGYLLGAAGGFALTQHAEWGMYLVSASLLILIVRSVLTAWMFMFVRTQTHLDEAK